MVFKIYFLSIVPNNGKLLHVKHNLIHLSGTYLVS